MQLQKLKNGVKVSQITEDVECHSERVTFPAGHGKSLTIFEERSNLYFRNIILVVVIRVTWRCKSGVSKTTYRAYTITTATTAGKIDIKFQIGETLQRTNYWNYTIDGKLW